MNSNTNILQNIFGMSSGNVYIFVGIFLSFVFILIVLQIVLKKIRKHWITYLPFIAIFFSLIIVLPFEAKVNYLPWGWSKDGIANTCQGGMLWYAQIMQFAIVIGNFYMIFLVIFLLIAMFFNLIKNVFLAFYLHDTYKLLRYFLIFIGISICVLLLINLYRVFPIYQYDMNNNPAISFVGCGSPVGIKGFNGQGYWPFFISNFLIAYFFTGNFNVIANTNIAYSANTFMQNNALPIQVPIILGLFSLAIIIGFICSKVVVNHQQFLKITKKIQSVNNSMLNIVYACLTVASFSFFSESLLQSQIGTWLHLSFVFLLMIICWLIFYIFSYIFSVSFYHLSPKQYLKVLVQYLHHAFKRSNYDKEIKLTRDFLLTHCYKEQQTNNIIRKEYAQLTYIAETVIFPLILIGYLSFMPTNGYSVTSAVNSAGYWIAMFYGSFCCFAGSFGISNISTVAQNIQASCAFNVMCGTNTGIFGPFGFIMNKFRVQINLNFLLMLVAFEHHKKQLKKAKQIKA